MIIVVFLSSENSQKGPKMRLLLDIPMLKTFQLQGASPAHWLPDQGLCPWTSLKASPQTPVIGSPSALAMCPPHTWPSWASPPENNFSLRPWCSNMLKMCWQFYNVLLEISSSFYQWKNSENWLTFGNCQKQSVTFLWGTVFILAFIAAAVWGLSSVGSIV